MSDQGERGARWTEMNDEIAATDEPTGPIQQIDSTDRSGERGATASARPDADQASRSPDRTEPAQARLSGPAESPSPDENPDDDWRPAERPGGGTAAERPAVNSWFERPPRPPAPPRQEPDSPEDSAAESADQAPAGFWITAAKSPQGDSPGRDFDDPGGAGAFEEPSGAAFAGSRDSSPWASSDGPTAGPGGAFGEPSAPEPAGSPAAAWGEPTGERPSWEREEPAPGEAARRPGAFAESREESFEASSAKPSPGTSGQEPGDVRVAPLPADGPAKTSAERPGWEGSLFDGSADGGGGVPGYAPVEMPGPSTPPKPGRPSSGSWEMPEWIREEERRAKEGLSTSADVGFDEETGRSRRIALLAGALVVVVLIGAGGYFFLRRGDSAAATVPPPRAVKESPTSALPQITTEPQVKLPPNKAMPRFSGSPARVVGMLDDRRAGLSYPRLGAPWRVPTARNDLAVPGWSGQQAVAAEQRGEQARHARLLTGVLQSPLAAEYTGPRSLRTVTAKALRDVIELYYDFPHQERALASQPLNVGGRRGWLISSYLKFKRPGVKATGEVVAVAVIDTGRSAPAVVLAGVPNTHRAQWPDINLFFSRLKPITKATE